MCYYVLTWMVMLIHKRVLIDGVLFLGLKWDTICLPKNKGGLGIKDLIKFNEALLGKWG